MKEVWKIIVAVIIVILIVLGMLYVIDTSRMKQNKPVLFSTWGRDYAPPVKENHENKDTQEIEEYSEKKAIDEGWIVITNDKKVYNKGNLDRFIENTDINAKNRKEDSIKIVQYTREGDPIITELSYKIKDETYLFKGEQVNETTYILKVDNTRDRFAADRKITIDDDIPGQHFGIVEEKSEKEVTIQLALCSILEYATKDAKQYKTINVCSYPKDSKIMQEYPYFYGTVIESNANNIIVEPREGESIRKSADKISIDLGKHSDVVYMVGTNVKINYDGSIKESYPAQVKAIKIEVKSAENFEIKFFKKSNSGSKREKILDKSETKKLGIYSYDYNIYSYSYDYNIYSYNGTVNIIIDGKETSLRDALLENRITMNEIIAKANKDFPNAVSYDDGGSIEYHYKEYTIIKVHKIDGNRDVYIGEPKLNINDLKL